MRYGFVPPLGRHGVDLVQVTDGNIMVCAKKQEKSSPAVWLKTHWRKKSPPLKPRAAVSVARSGKPSKTKFSFITAPRLQPHPFGLRLLRPEKQWLVVNSGSAKRAEEIIQALRLALGTLPCVPLASEVNPVMQMSQWLGQGYADAPFVFGEECELNAPKDGRIVRVKKQDLSADEIRNHLTVGLRVQKMALHWKDAISFVLDEQLAVKRLKFNDVLSEQADDRRAESAAEEFDASFAIMALAVRDFIAELLAALGGQAPVDQL